MKNPDFILNESVKWKDRWRIDDTDRKERGQPFIIIATDH